MCRPDLPLAGWATPGLVLLLAVLAGCEPIAREEEGPVRVAVPSDLEYPILNPDRAPGLRCSPDVSLSYKVPRDVLESVTLAMLDDELEECSFGVVAFYLPHMEPGSGAWAVAEFTPEITVTLLGLGAREERELVEKARRSQGSVGTWIDDTSYAAVVSVVREGASLFVERYYRGGEKVREEIVFGRYDGRTGFETKDENELGRYYVINLRGYLETHDDHGRLSDARLYRLDRDVDRLVIDEEARRRERARIVAARAEEVRESGVQRRLDAWRGWIETFRASMEPVRHPVMRLTTIELAEQRVRECEELQRGLDAVPVSLRDTPHASIDIGPLELGLSRISAACQEERWVGVLVESRATTAVWRELDRTLYLVAQQFRTLQPDAEP